MRTVSVIAVLALLGVATLAQAQTFTTLYNFKGEPDGADPNAGLLLGSNGDLYGTAAGGGTHGYGTVFEFSKTTGETTLYNFCSQSGCADGEVSIASVTQDSAGNIYGTTYDGGADGYGVVFKLSSSGQQTVVHSFTNGDDGGTPASNVVLDSKGNLFGTATTGGSGGYGVVFKLSPSGKETVLHSFTNGKDGGVPNAVILDSNGRLYGSTYTGGKSGAGTVFEVTQKGKMNVLYSFKGAPDGGGPLGIILDGKGNLYGTTLGGGTSGYGTAFKLAKSGRETVLYSFCSRSACSDGQYPNLGPVLDARGNLFGTTQAGGDQTCNCGVVFEVRSNKQQIVLHTFVGSDGRYPFAGLIGDESGNLYGTTNGGGSGSECESYGCGTVFELTP